ncbi:MAG: hypothetical protein HY098_02230 [Nitrospinae bacterium]|nr:hypothetical protein [Nitrospinota bacterium]
MKASETPLWVWPPLAALAAYANALGGSFQFDDWNIIVNRDDVHTLGRFLTTASHGARPLLNLSYAMNWAASPRPFGFILVNVLLHAANALLAFFVAKKLVESLSTWDEKGAGTCAFVVARLFALHPVQTESVSYVAGRSESLMAFFYFASFLAYLDGAGRERAAPFSLFSLFMFACALAARETAATLPAALFLYERLRKEPGPWSDAAKRLAPFCLLLLLGALVMAASPRYRFLLAYSMNIRGAASAAATNLLGIGYLLSRVVAVGGLNIDPDLRVADSFSPPVILLAASFAAALTFAWVVRKRAPLVSFGIGWFFLHLVPTNSVIPRLDVASEHHLYVPLFGLILAVFGPLTATNPAVVKSGRARVAFGLLLFLLFAFTVHRNAAYATEIALWEDAAAKSPAKARPHNNLGHAYHLAGRFADAEREYRAALACDPGFYKSRRNLSRLEDDLRKGAR